MRVAVLDVATRMFAARGPGATSIRQIAHAVGINHALVHRHVGSKQDLLRAVLERNAVEVATAARETNNPREAVARLFLAALEHRHELRSLARVMLEVENYRGLQHDFPLLNRMIQLVASERQLDIQPNQTSSPEESNVRVAVGAAAALTLGWEFFEPFLRTAAGLDRCDPYRVRLAIVPFLEAIIAAPPMAGAARKSEAVPESLAAAD